MFKLFPSFCKKKSHQTGKMAEVPVSVGSGTDASRSNLPSKGKGNRSSSSVKIIHPTRSDSKLPHRQASLATTTSSMVSEDTASTERQKQSQTPMDILEEQQLQLLKASNVPICRLVQMRNHRRWEIHGSIVDAVGQTPIVRLRSASVPRGVSVYVKCENTNPAGSIKDRLALGIIEWAEKHGMIKPGQTVVEASSGNTGVGMAMVCAARGYPFVCVMSEAFSVERRKLMRFLGARVVLTPKQNKATGMVIKAQELADAHGFFYAQQFENEANAWIHEQTTGPEIINAFAKINEKLHHFFMAYGTGGTVLGVSRAFRKVEMGTMIHLCEPASAAMVSSGIPTNYPERNSGAPTTAFDTAHPVWSPHLMQGWATDFIPRLLSKAKEEGGYQKVHQVSGADAINMSQHLAKTEGIFVGISGGGILAAAIRHAQTCPPGTNILAVLTDTGERYLSTPLFEHIPVEMTPEEQLLSDSTPSMPPPAPPALSGILPADTDRLFDV